MKIHTLLLASLIAITALKLSPVFCDKYDGNDNAVGTAGGACFEREIGIDYALYTLRNSSSFFWDLFSQDQEQDRKNVTDITLNIQPMKNIVTNIHTEVSSYIILMNSDYIGNYSGDIKTEFTGIMYHEIARVRQWNGNGNAPFGLITGIADFFRLKAGFAAAHWGPPGEGSRWDQGFEATAMFLDYCNDLSVDFVAKLNGLMKSGYDNYFFLQLTGRFVDELWHDYKAHYGG